MWQPIETAPKDKDVLLYCPMHVVVRGRWNDCKYSTKPRPYWTHDRERLHGVINTRNDQPTHWMPLPEEPGAQAKPAPSFADAYQGAMEEVVIWKKRALEAEDLNRRFVAEINGHTHMGEPAQPAPSVPDDVLRRALLRISEDGWFMFLEDHEVAPRMREIAREALEAAPEAKP